MKSLLTAASLIALLAAAPAWAQNTSNSGSNSQSLSSQDKTFLTKAASGSRAEVQLGRLAERKAANPAVKEFGRWMATDHRLANKRLMAIGRTLGQPVQPRLSQKDAALKDRLQGLSGTQFDRQYMQAMVQDHRKDIEAFQQEEQNGQARPLKAFARNMLPVLKQHLKEAQQLSSGGMAMGAGSHSATSGSGSSTSHESR